MAAADDPKTANPPVASAEKEEAAPGPEKAKSPQENKLKVFLSRLTGRERMISKVTAFAFFLVFLDLVMIRPINHNLAQIDDKIKVAEETIPKRLMILKYKKQILENYKNIKPYLVDSTLTQDMETSGFLSDVEQVAKGAGISMNTSAVKVDKKKSETVYELSVDIEGKGSLEQLRDFMKTLESAHQAIRVIGFNLRPQGKESEDLKYSFSIVKIGVKEKSLAALQ